MKALAIDENREVCVVDVPRPARNSESDVEVSMSWVSINRLDLFSSAGMAFARQKLPMVAGVEGAGVVSDPGGSSFERGARVVIYPGIVCGQCASCQAGRENLCEAEPRIRGFNVPGIAAERVVVDARHLFEVPDGVKLRDAACVPVTLATVEHMLIENARLMRGESILVHAAGSGVGSTAIQLAKSIGARVIATAGTDAKVAQALEIGADHAINYTTSNFPSAVRRLTQRRGVDVVFEHTGADTWEGSLRSLARGGRLVTCGSHTGNFSRIDLMQLFNRQLRIFGSFGGNYGNVRTALERLAGHEVQCVVDTEFAMSDYDQALDRMRERDLFGKMLLKMPEWQAHHDLAKSGAANAVASGPATAMAHEELGA